jgi:hypothetical protein
VIELFNILCIALVGLLVSAIILVVGFCIVHAKEKKEAKKTLSSIESKGYKWASQPWGHIKTFISARVENVKRVGILPDGTFLYETESHKKFLYGSEITTAILDVANKVHMVKPDVLSLPSEDMIIPADWYVINDYNEVYEYLNFYNNLMISKGNDGETLDYHWDAELLDKL